jgi:SAM-dependent methyltransferase
VLEHLNSPEKVLRKISSLLKPDGNIILSLPNMSGFDAQILWDDGYPFFAPTHLNYFFRESIHVLLHRCRLEVKSIETPGKLDVDVVSNRMHTFSKAKANLGEFLSKRLNPTYNE